jgi:hypothetical protein
MMANGAVEDEVAAHLRMGKTRLRGRHIRDLKAGREIRRQQTTAAEAEQLSKKEAQLREAWFAGFNSKWQRPDGRCPLHQNMTLAQAEAEFARRRAIVTNGEDES